MADFYGTLAEANTYHAERGNTTWTGSDDDLNAALLRGSEYIDAAYRSGFPGIKTGQRSQTREWPRTGAADIEGNYIDYDEVPNEVLQASYEAALRELVTPGSLQPDYNPGQQRKRVKADVIEVEYTAPHGAASSQPVINIIRGLLAPILTGSSNTHVSGRAVRT